MDEESSETEVTTERMSTIRSANLSRKSTVKSLEQVDKAQCKYEKLMHEMGQIVEKSSAEIWNLFLISFRGKYGNIPIATSMVRDFMAKESNKHIAQTDENGDLTLTLCALQIENRWIAFKVLQFIRSSLYNRLITVLIFVHILTSMQLPRTP